MIQMISDLPYFVKDYFELFDPEKFCKDQYALKKFIERVFKNENLNVDLDLAEKYFKLSKYLGFQLYEWEKFVLGLHLCVFKDGLPRFSDLFCFVGRGAGKDGLISLESMALISPYNPIREYDVDICANNEDQATRPVKDLITAFEADKKKLRKYFYWTQEKILGIKNHAYIKGHTNNAKGKDGLRSGCVIFNEYHAYENYDNVNVFTTGLGKKKHPRRSIFTTNGDVVDGPLDELIKDSEDILYRGVPDNGLLPFICRIDSFDDVHDENHWHKANPSLRYKPELLTEIRKEYNDWKNNPARLPAFMTKRMNLRESNNELKVTEWANIESTNSELPDLKGKETIVGIDFSKTTDWAAVNLHFKKGDTRYDINHAWICMQGDDIARLKCPYKDWASKGQVSLVYAPEINPQILVDYIFSMAKLYRIKMICADSYRYTLLSDYLRKIGFCPENKNIFMVRPSDIMKVYPVIDRCFSNHFFVWGDTPHLRWATNNAKLVRAKRSVLASNGEIDTGNFLIGKIEPKSRKTDPFMALVASMTKEDLITDDVVLPKMPQLKTYVY